MLFWYSTHVSSIADSKYNLVTVAWEELYCSLKWRLVYETDAELRPLLLQLAAFTFISSALALHRPPS